MAKRKAYGPAEVELVNRMVAAGASRVQIAKALGCSPTTLRRHFAAQINGKKPRGVPAREFTDQERQTVSTCVSFGIPYAEIARLLEIGTTTLKTEFREELATGLTRANVAVAGALFRNATAGASVRAQIFWLRSRAGWVESGGDEAKPLPENEADVLRRSIAQLSPEGRAAYRQVLDEMGAKSPLTHDGPGPGDVVQ